MTLSTRSSAGLLLVGLGCLAWGAWRAWETHRFLGRSARATGTVVYPTENETNLMLVEIRGPDGRLERRIPVRSAWWTPPWRHLRGAEVGVRFDPRGDYDSPLTGDRGRGDSWGQLWAGAAFWCGLGGLIIVAWALARSFRARVSLSARVGAGPTDGKG